MRVTDIIYVQQITCDYMAIISSLYDYIPNWKIAAGQESSKPVKTQIWTSQQDD